jgi:transposase
MTIEPCFVGIDVSKDRLDVCVRRAGTVDWFGVVASRQAPAALVDRIVAAAPTLVVLEATGGFERPLLMALAAAGVAVVRVNPRQIRAFARGAGLLAKTDRLDAGILALYAERMRPPVRPLPDVAIRRLQERVRRRRQLVEMRKQEKQRRAQITDADLLADIDTHLAWLAERLARVEAEIAALVAAVPALADKAALMRSVPGIGPASVACLLAEAPELGSLDGRQAASLLGVAPHACDSGRYRGRRRCWGGRRDLRRALYMPAETARRKCPRFKAFYDRLRAQGKSHKCALIAVLRKLVITLNAMLRSNSPFIDHNVPQHSC